MFGLIKSFIKNLKRDKNKKGDVEQSYVIWMIIALIVLTIAVVGIVWLIKTGNFNICSIKGKIFGTYC